MPEKTPQLLEISRKAEKKINTDKEPANLAGVTNTTIRKASRRIVGDEVLRDEARRQQRGSSNVAHALAVTKLHKQTGGRGTVDPRRLTVLDRGVQI